ncbi:hypothetical protein AWR27_05285 [Spirosoma montaniterrae]|uniref:Uncharacterized protein n=1 Tax=Spirosoma montaniterrae TaxID=1178516 RepID=A0A1P9WTS6_9BACT|nr:hypothetical protein AWR27_05285 [Spirosoma montaniterrae]
MRNERQFSIKTLIGVSAPNQVVPATGNLPLGVEINYSWTGLQRRAWEQCNCFARVGTYANYIGFGNPVALGRTAGAGLFFEPLIRYGHRTYFSVRASVGLTYVTRIYDPITNPTNRHVSLPVSSMIGLSVNGYYQLNSRFHLTVSGNYNHISNGGTRQPNQGLNLPSASLGLTYLTRTSPQPDTQLWTRTPLTRRWLARVLLLGSVRVLPQTATTPEMALPLFGLKLLAGYRLSSAHALSGGVEFVDDQYFREQVKQWRYVNQQYRQATLLAGYEFWHGRYLFTAHMGWNVVRPQPYKPATYQKYGLLYRLNNGLTFGFDVKAFGDDTKGFQLAGGMSF